MMELNMILKDTKAAVGKDGKYGSPPDSFLIELVTWFRKANDGLFQQNANIDIYSSVIAALGPWESLLYRKAVMMECVRVLGGFESSYDWNCGVDTTNKTSITPWT